MKQATVSTLVKLCNAGPRKFVHIQNLGTGDLFVKYDGDAATLTVANGVKIASGDIFMLNNALGGPTFFCEEIWAISSGTSDVRIMGEQ